MLKGSGKIPLVDTTYLEPLLFDNNNLLKSIPYSEILKIPHFHLQNFANLHGIYQFATTELIDFLKNEIGSNKCIEICAGNGVLSRELGIIGIDNRSQYKGPAKKFIDQHNLVATKPPKEIKNFEALEAVRLYMPHTVIGAFVTQWSTWAEDRIGIKGSPVGVHEDQILKRVKKYLMIGHEDVHKGKRIFDLPHKTFSFPWLVTRCFDQTLNRIWLWENK